VNGRAERDVRSVGTTNAGARRHGPADASRARHAHRRPSCRLVVVTRALLWVEREPPRIGRARSRSSAREVARQGRGDSSARTVSKLGRCFAGAARIGADTRTPFGHRTFAHFQNGSPTRRRVRFSTRTTSWRCASRRASMPAGAPTAKGRRFTTQVEHGSFGLPSTSERGAGGS
jgi:hypothetical protein